MNVSFDDDVIGGTNDSIQIGRLLLITEGTSVCCVCEISIFIEDERNDGISKSI